MRVWSVRLAGLFALASTLWCGPWLLFHLNLELIWLAVPFAAALGLTMTLTIVTFINEWQRSAPESHPVAAGDEPVVGVLIPTLGEPVWMVGKTAESVLQQDWPQDKLVVIISDDAGAAEIANLASRLQAAYPKALVRYHVPPRRGTAARRGDAKAGNLNSAYDLLLSLVPDIGFVETRDADDQVGSPEFLRETVGLLQFDAKLAYVQTIKTAVVSPDDPFNNLEPLFYRGMLMARNDANAVFPCGSGLVWRRVALDDIGGFPIWSLVEDLMSGIEALKRGWKSAYLPIVGAHAQHAPEDIPNVYKQRGTWALDTMRIMFWMNLDGLNLRQRLQFAQMAIFYLHSLATLTFMVCLTVTLVSGHYPFSLSGSEAAIRFWPLVISVEIFLIALNRRQPFESIWRLREMATGLAPLYAGACLRALFGGPDRIYRYRVTRKTDQHQWYWRETAVQTGLLLVLISALVYRVMNTTSWSSFDAGLVYLTLLQTLPLAGFVRKSWFGIDLRARLLGSRSSARQLDEAPMPANPGD
jgi:cellulose synthase (UDP-forming)